MPLWLSFYWRAGTRSADISAHIGAHIGERCCCFDQLQDPGCEVRWTSILTREASVLCPSSGTVSRRVHSR